MRLTKSGLVVVSVMLAAAVQASADNVSIEYTEFDGTGVSVGIQTDHNPDADPFKGYFQLVTVKNISSEDWGDFHFQLIRSLGIPGLDPSQVVFGEEGTNFCSQTGYTYIIDNNAVGGPKLDFYFYSNPVEVGETVSFQVWTDNTANQMPFGVFYYPTVVPEPATMSLLGIGMLGLILKKRRNA